MWCRAGTLRYRRNWESEHAFPLILLPELLELPFYILTSRLRQAAHFFALVTLAGASIAWQPPSDRPGVPAGRSPAPAQNAEVPRAELQYRQL